MFLVYWSNWEDTFLQLFQFDTTCLFHFFKENTNLKY